MIRSFYNILHSSEVMPTAPTRARSLEHTLGKGPWQFISNDQTVADAQFLSTELGRTAGSYV